MPNYSLVINSQFKPYSFKEMLEPLLLYREAYKEAEDKYNTLAEGANTLESMLNKDLDTEEYQQYQDYLRNVESASEKLSKEGLSLDLRNLANKYKADFIKKITPIQQAAERRNNMLNAEQQLGPGYVFEYDASNTPLKKFMENPVFFPKRINIDKIRERSAAEFGQISKELQNFAIDPNMYKNDFDSTVVAKYGYNKKMIADIAEQIRNGKANISDVAADMIYKNIYNSTGVDSWSNNIELGQNAVRNAIAEGVIGAMGQYTPQIVTDKKKLEDYKYQKEIDKYNATHGTSSGIAKSFLEPFPDSYDKSKDQNKFYNKIQRYKELLEMIYDDPSIMEATYHDVNGVVNLDASNKQAFRPWPYAGPNVPRGVGQQSDSKYSIKEEFLNLQKELAEAVSSSYPDAKINIDYSIKNNNKYVPFDPILGTGPLIVKPEKEFIYNSNLDNYLNDLATITRGYNIRVDQEAMQNMIRNSMTADYKKFIRREDDKKVKDSDLEEIRSSHGGNGWEYIHPYIDDGNLKFDYNNVTYILEPGFFGKLHERYWMPDYTNKEPRPLMKNLWETQQYKKFNDYLNNFVEEWYYSTNTVPIGQSHTGKVVPSDYDYQE